MTAFQIVVGITLGIVGVLIVDTMGAAASRYLRFSYGLLIPLQVAIWCVSALVASSGSSGGGEALLRGAAACLVVGVVDSTVGWRLSLRIHPSLAERLSPAALSPHGMRMTAVRCTALATAVGGASAMWFQR